MKIKIVGQGNFAKAFIQQQIDPHIQMVPWDPADREYDGIIHVGSGRQLPEIIAELNTSHKPFIQASTHLDTNLPTNILFPWIEAPNLCLMIAKVFYALDFCGLQFSRFDKQIIESHQAKKKQVSDTALRFASALHMDPNQIHSIRDPKMQIEKMQVPQEFLDGHAYHCIILQSKGAELSINTKVNGRQTYVEGAIEIAKIWHELENRIYTVTELIASGLL